jgi:hypothetical protein
MTRQHYVRITVVALAVLSIGTGLQARDTAVQGGAAAAAAAKASPELVSSLSKELGSTPDQAAGAAGALFGIAQSRLKPDEFAQVSKAVPGIDLLLKAGPAMGGMAGAAGGGMSQLTGLAGAASAFSKLGLKPELVAKAIPILTSFVTKSGGANVGKILASVLK